MSNKSTQEQKYAERQARIEKHHHRSDHFFRHVLHYAERIVASITLLVLIIAVGYQIFLLFTDLEYLFDIQHFLHNILTIVVGFEFVRMMIDTPPANILEVLTVAITRHVILSHENPWANVASIACIAALFAIRRYLIRRSELKEELVDVE